MPWISDAVVFTGFSGWSWGKKSLDANMLLKERWGIHDIGRSCATHWREHLGVTCTWPVTRLRDLGLLDVFEDLVDHRTEALAVNGLAASRLRLPDDARTAIATVALPQLSIAWGGERARPPVADLELTRLGLMAGDAEVVAASAAEAMLALEGRSAAERARFGAAAIALLEQEVREVSWLLLSRTANAVATAGEGAAADILLSKAVDALEARRKAGEAVDRLEAGYLLMEQGRRLVQRGELVEAEPLSHRQPISHERAEEKL